MSQVVEDFMSLVQKGREGKNQGCPIGLEKLADYIGDLCSGLSILIGAPSGTGKTTFSQYAYIYEPIMSDQCEKFDVKYLIFNFEMTQEQILSKLLSIYLYYTYGEVMSFKDMFSRGQKDGEANILSDEGYALLEECKPILEKFASRITFCPDAKTYEAYTEKLFDWVSQYGTFDNPFNEFGDNTFTPNNPDQILVVITDHLNMVSSQPTIKTTIDNIANMQVSARNMCNILTFVNIMQLNRGASGDARIRAQMFEPTSDDFRDSSVVYDGSMIVMTLFSPFKVGLKDHRKYNIELLGDRYVSIKVLKYRFGMSNIRDAVSFYGEVSIYKELPKHDEIYDYGKYRNPDWIINNEDENVKSIHSFKL